jgi:predicted enzyme related to lactoylglutathione lyase
MALGSLGQVHIPVADVDRSIPFYRDVLGIPFLFRVRGRPMAFFQAGDVRLYLGSSELAEVTASATLYFRVDDIETERERLTQAGVEVSAPEVAHRDDAHELWLAALTDPDHHHIVLMEERPR